MKKNFVLAMAVAIFAMAISVSAQKAANFGGTWTLDVAKSKLGDRNRIESQTMTVTQTASEIKVATDSKMTAPPAGAPAGGGGGAGGGRPGGGGPQSYAYTIGKETKMDQQMGQNTVPVTLSAKADGSNLWLTRSFTFTGQNGDVTSVTKDSWSLGPDGKSLTVNRDSTRNGNTASTTMVYTKN